MPRTKKRRLEFEYATLEMLNKMAQSPKGGTPSPAEAVFGPGNRDSHEWQEEYVVKNILKAPSIRHSSLFDLDVPPCILDEALKLIPEDVRSNDNDTKESLVERISASGWYDKLNPLAAGGSRGKMRVDLNATDYSQARRKAWSAVVQDEHKDESGALVRTMYAYGKPNSRIRTDLHATPMPTAIGELGTYLFLAARHVLSDVCASSPPNHCQLLGYYGLFDSKMGRHKDDHKLETYHRVVSKLMTVEDAVKTSKGAMVPGSDVLVYSTGPLPMLFSWCFAPTDAPYRDRDRHSRFPYFQIYLPHGSLLVFKSIDDLSSITKSALTGVHKITTNTISKRLIIATPLCTVGLVPSSSATSRLTPTE